MILSVSYRLSRLIIINYGGRCGRQRRTHGLIISRNLLSFYPATPESMRLDCVQQASITTRVCFTAIRCGAAPLGREAGPHLVESDVSGRWSVIGWHDDHVVVGHVTWVAG